MRTSLECVPFLSIFEIVFVSGVYLWHAGLVCKFERDSGGIEGGIQGSNLRAGKAHFSVHWKGHY